MFRHSIINVILCFNYQQIKAIISLINTKFVCLNSFELFEGFVILPHN